MKNSKMLTIMMIILAVITTAGIIVIVLLLNGNDEEADSPTIDEIVESSVEIEEITTNLADGESYTFTYKIDMSKILFEETDD